jgi:hypothetical protein
MNEDQMEVIQAVQEVLRGLTTTLLAMNPDAIPRVAKGLSGFAAAPGLSPTARAMLTDLASGVALLERAGQPRS